jgi:hypothetical protein
MAGLPTALITLPPTTSSTRTGTRSRIPAFDCLACQNDLEEVEPEVFLTENGMLSHAAWVANGELDESGSEMQNGSDAWYGAISLTEDESTH